MGGWLASESVSVCIEWFYTIRYTLLKLPNIPKYLCLIICTLKGQLYKNVVVLCQAECKGSTPWDRTHFPSSHWPASEQRLSLRFPCGAFFLILHDGWITGIPFFWFSKTRVRQRIYIFKFQSVTNSSALRIVGAQGFAFTEHADLILIRRTCLQT